MSVQPFDTGVNNATTLKESSTERSGSKILSTKTIQNTRIAALVVGILGLLAITAFFIYAGCSNLLTPAQLNMSIAGASLCGFTAGILLGILLRVVRSQKYSVEPDPKSDSTDESNMGSNTPIDITEYDEEVIPQAPGNPVQEASDPEKDLFEGDLPPLLETDNPYIFDSDDEDAFKPTNLNQIFAPDYFKPPITSPQAVNQSKEVIDHPLAPKEEEQENNEVKIEHKKYEDYDTLFFEQPPTEVKEPFVTSEPDLFAQNPNQEEPGLLGRISSLFN